MFLYLHRRTRCWKARAARRGGPTGGRLRAISRALAYITVVSFAFSLVSLRSVYGRVRDASLEIGRDLLPLKSILGPAQPLLINGAKVFVGARHVDESVGDVVERFEAYCEEQSGNLAEDLERLDPSQQAELPSEFRRPNRLGILRNDAGDEAAIACIAAPQGSRGIDGFITRAQNLLSTGDLGELGRLRYLFARKNQKAGGTDVITLWQEGSFPIMRMLFPEEDVPGSDTESVPRPQGSMRVLSAEVPGTGYGMRAYATSESAERVLQGYEESLPLLGWVHRPPPDVPESEVMSDGVRTFTKEDAAIYIIADDSEGRTIVQVVEMGTRGSVVTHAAD